MPVVLVDSTRKHKFDLISNPRTGGISNVTIFPSVFLPFLSYYTPSVEIMGVPSELVKPLSIHLSMLSFLTFIFVFFSQ